MPTRYGVSPWVHEFPDARRPDYPRLREDQFVQVVVVGGGLTGCATAYACALAGIKVLLVEAGRIGHGSAGFGAGLLLPEPGPSFQDVTQAHGLRAARRVFDVWRRGSLDAAAVLRRLKIKCDLAPLDALHVGPAAADKLLRREFQAQEDAGVHPAWLQGRALASAAHLDAGSAIRTRDAFAVDPYRACLGMAAAAKSRGAILIERSPVTRVRFGPDDVQVTTAHGTVHAATVVITTGTATSVFSPLRRHFKRRETYLAMTESVPAAMRAGLPGRNVTLCDSETPCWRMRWVGADRLLLAGGDQGEQPERRRKDVLVQRTGQLMYHLLRMYPVISGLRAQYGWHLWYGDTADGLMYIGPHRNYPRHLFALGGATDSIAGAFVAARILLRSIQRAPEKGDDVFSWVR